VPDAEAVPLLQAVVTVAAERDALRVRDAARAGLVRRGGQVLVTDEAPARSLTHRRVLDLAQAGHDVHEIAQLLFLTPGTVRGTLDRAGAAR
jgi:DNA-binding NarL/FixJ family response regulator